MSEWQPIETAPEGRLLLYGLYEGTPYMAVGAADTKWVYWFVPTHWMPLPAPPAARPPALAPYPRCTRLLREAGKPYPRTCQECGLGPCARERT